jgi:anti-sigma B factor antagonist
VLTVTMLATESYALANVVGEADFTVSGQLGEPLAAALLAGTRQLVIDVSGLSFIDVACVRVLVEARATAEDAGGTLMLVAPQPTVTRILELCRADQLIAVDGNLTRAVLARCGRPGKWLPPDSGRSLKIFGPGWVGRAASRQ